MNAELKIEVNASTKSSFTRSHAGLLQRKCACGGIPGPDGECAECRSRRLSLQRKTQTSTSGDHQHLPAPPIVHAAFPTHFLSLPKECGCPSLAMNDLDFIRFFEEFSARVPRIADKKLSSICEEDKTEPQKQQLTALNKISVSEDISQTNEQIKMFRIQNLRKLISSLAAILGLEFSVST